MPGVALDPPDFPSTSPKASRCASAASCAGHDGGDHLLVLEGGGFTYLSVPPLLSESMEEEGKLCFLDHRLPSWDPLSDMCCLREAGHVHAHVHRGEITEDVLLEQCMEEAGCTLPMPWDLGSVLNPISSSDEHESDHEHQDGCGHNRIAHGDHFDWLIPLKDGSYVLSHAQPTVNGGSQFIEHGRLVKVGESLGQLKRRPKQLVDLFTYEGPKKEGYESLPTAEDAPTTVPSMMESDIVAIVRSPSHGFKAISSPKHVVAQEDVVKVTIPRLFKSQGMTKTTFDVMGICCPSEVPLIKKILGPLPGVEEVLVNPTSKTVTVLHDPTIIADVQLVKILNEARLDASIHQRGQRRITHRWPSPWTMGAGVLLLVSFLHYAWPPLKWVALGSVAVGVPPILVRSLVALRRCVLDINVLMIIAVSGAIALGDYVEAGSIAFLFTLADWLESRSSDKARDAISNVADLAPQTAVLMDGQRVAVEDVSLGTLLAVKAGELIPIDGEVVSGKSSIDESNVTGESKPVEKTLGAVVWAGTMNLSGYISVKTTALAEDSAVARMVRLVEEAQNQHSRTEQLVERVAKYYTPLVVLAALLIAAIPWAAGSHRHKHWIYLALVLLVVSCPCALVISTPVTTTCGIAQAARAGLLVRGGSHLEALARVTVVAMDKTGTLTEGHFRVLDVHPVNCNYSIQQILYWITCVESKSSHPLAPALVAFARLQGEEPTGDITDFEIIPGMGVSALVDGHKVQIGNTRLAANCIGFEDSKSEIVDTWSSLGATIGWVCVDDQPVGVFGVADSLREEATEAVAGLKKLGIKVVVLSGDSASAVAAVHSQIGDIDVHAELFPEDKVKLVKELKSKGVTAMVGDGINDAPALALADVGIAMGVAGSAVAMETADVALMTNDLRKIAVAIKLGRDVRLKIIQNVSLSFLTKITIIILAAVGYPSLWAAVLADVGTCLVVIFNSMRLLNRKKGVVLPKFESRKSHDHKHGDHTHHVHDHDHHELDSHHHHQYHQELGKIRDDIHNHDHGMCRDHDYLVQDKHDHGVSCVHHHQHERKEHHDHAVKVPCWRRHHHGHGGKDSHHHHGHGEKHSWSKLKLAVVSFSGASSKSKKCCTKTTLDNSGCSDSRVTLEAKCCSSSPQSMVCSKSKQTSRSVDAVPANSNCCTKLTSVPANSNCCTKPNVVPASSNCCTKLNVVPANSNCCTKLNVVPANSNCCTKLNVVPANSNCCTKLNVVPANSNCCTKLSTAPANSHCSTKLNAVPTNTDFCTEVEKAYSESKRVDESKCCSSVDSKCSSKAAQGAQTISTNTQGGDHCCLVSEQENQVCSNAGMRSMDGHFTRLRQGGHNHHEKPAKNDTINSGPSCGSRHVDTSVDEHIGSSCCEKGPPGSPSRVIRRKSGTRDCCARDVSLITFDRHGEPEEKETCCSTAMSSQSILKCGSDSDHDLPNVHGKVAVTENYPSCGMPKCKLTDHSKCATEALVHSPLRDLTVFTRPVSPL